MSKIKVFGFIGTKGSGKNTSFELFKEKYPSIQEYSFAGLLKERCSKVFNLDMSFFINPQLKEKELIYPITLNKSNLAQLIFNEYLFPLSEDSSEIINKFSGLQMKTPRQLLQIVGTDILRELDTNVHIKALLNSLPDEGIIGITDIRFINEFNSLEDKYGKNFTPFFIFRSSLNTDSHSSETEVKLMRDFNKSVIINNTGNLSDLRLLINNILEKV